MLSSVPANHPTLPGHFPGHPVVPGVVIMDYVLAAVTDALPAWRVTGIHKLKFLQPLLPCDAFSVQLADVKNGRVRFSCWCGEQRIAEGNLLLEMPA